jgi:hypothetical protein
MVLLVDLDSDDNDQSLQARTARFLTRPTLPVEGEDEKNVGSQAEREISFAAILTCYPYAGTD